MLGARAVLSLLDPDADPDARFDGALLVAGFLTDLYILRRALTADD